MHSSLDALGFVPVIGSVADFINGTWYLFEGNYGDASLAFIGAIPLIGDGIKALPGGAKLLSKGKEVISLGALRNIRTKMFGRVRKICLGAPPQTITGLAVTVFFDCPNFVLDPSRNLPTRRWRLSPRI